MNTRSRNYCFTVNNYEQSDIDNLNSIECKYIIFGKEVGQEGTKHLQGYINFKTLKSFKQLKKLIPKAHIEAIKGSAEDNIKYCSKDGDYEERGSRPATQEEKGVLGKRTYEEAWKLAKEGNIEDIHPTLKVKYWNTLRKIEEHHRPKPNSLPALENYWYWGSTGTGKSRKARDENPDAYIKDPNKWWDNYRGEDVVIIDEWSPCHDVLGNHLKRWADHHPFQAERKGGSMLIRPKKIIITSNYKIDDCFLANQDREPMHRRFKEICFNPLPPSI